MSKHPADCTCDGTIFTDAMCEPCLKVVEVKLLSKIEDYDEKLNELEGDLDQVRFYLCNLN